MTTTGEPRIRDEDFDHETGAYLGPSPESEEDAGTGTGIEELVLTQGERINELSNELETLHRQTGEAIHQITASLTANNNALKDLTTAPAGSKPDEWNWKHLSGEQAAELLDKVREWVDWFNAHYAVSDSTRILGCWYRHPVVVEEITALWVAWRAAYFGHQKPDTSATYWHSAFLWPTLKRLWIEPWGYKNCGAGHRTQPAKDYVSTDDGYPALREALRKTDSAPVIPWPGTNPIQASSSATVEDAPEGEAVTFSSSQR